MSDEQAPQIPVDQLQMNIEELYREETYTDLRMGTLRHLVPVKIDGTVDDTRTARFTGEASILTQAGPVPVNAAIEANTLQEAIEAFPAAIQGGVEKLMEEVREMQRRESSRIVVPGRGPGAGGAPGAGGGKIELP